MEETKKEYYTRMRKEHEKRMEKCEHSGKDLVTYKGYEPPRSYCVKCGWFKP